MIDSEIAEQRSIGQQPRDGYDRSQVRMHWIVAVLVLAQLLIGLRIGTLPRTPDSHAVISSLMPVHLIIGTAIFCLMVARIRLRRRYGAPPSPPSTPFEATLLARINHYGFYVLLLTMPIIGWLAYATNGRARDGFAGLHGSMAVVLLLAIAAHILGAAYHAFIRQDGLVRRMGLGGLSGSLIPRDAASHR